ncbi:MAG: PA-phosphatase [Burkholderiales bacterium]|nr:MAG: PA-phosphatase [Burkholderiales bacterium]
MLLSLAAGAFVWTADEMREGETMLRDRQWLLALHISSQADHLLGGAPVLQLAREVTALGSPWLLCLLVGGVAGVLMAMRQRRLAFFIVASTSAGALFNTALKQGFERARPDLVPHEVIVLNASFPSGHAFGAAMVYLTLAALLTLRLELRAPRAVLLALAIGVTLAVGVSRIALGVHWPSDVLAGWAAGSAWALATWLVANTTGWFDHNGRHDLQD